MKTAAVFVCVGILAGNLGSQIARGFELDVKPGEHKITLGWPSQFRVPVGGVRVSAYEIQHSTDLRTWQTLTNVGTATLLGDPASLQLSLDNAAGSRFFRAKGSLSISSTIPDGDEIFGYGDAINEQLSQIGQITPQAFAAQFPPPAYLDHLTWDPTSARFWDTLNAQPRVIRDGGQGTTTLDYRLNAGEIASFKTNGFIVSERLGGHSFADVYYRIFSAELPVFVTSDSALQAWHRSYESVQGEIEALYMLPHASNLVATMQANISGVQAQYVNSPLWNSLVDVDYFLTVAKSLFMGSNFQASATICPASRVSDTLAAIRAQQLRQFVVYDRSHGTTPALIDFSQFKVRGYYTKTAELSRYFQGMMWLGLMDFRIAGNPDDPSSRELASALILSDLLHRANMVNEWQNADQFLKTFVGEADSMDFTQLSALMAANGISSSPATLTLPQLDAMQQNLLTGQLGLQNIQGAPFYSPLGADQLRLPRSFAVFGQRFVIDSWALTQSTYDRILQVNGTSFTKVQRRIPSGLDVAFSVLGNNAAIPELVYRMQNSQGVAFRDGLPYQQNLAAVRNVVDAQAPSAWNSTIYSHWLAALRELSAPTTGAEYPEAMRTRAWAEKTLTTQLASWTHLRHNTLLYAKESYTPTILCDYPYGFVEPRPGFWNAMNAMATHAASVVSALPFDGTAVIPQPAGSVPATVTISLPQLQAQEAAFLSNFATTMATLRDISQAELQQAPLTTNQVNFLKSVVEPAYSYFGYRTFTGWYPQLFYHPVRKETRYDKLDTSDEWDPVIVDVHTDQPAPLVQDPGAILHEGVGNVHLLVIAVDNGPDRILYAGPTLSYYEMLYPINQRQTDSDWKAKILNGLPPAPEWTRDYFFPGSITVPIWAQ